MDKETNAVDDQKHNRRQGIDLERDTDLEGTRIDPGIPNITENTCGGELPKHVERQAERNSHRSRSQNAGGLVAQPSPEKNIEHDGTQRDQGNPAQQVESGGGGR